MLVIPRVRVVEALEIPCSNAVRVGLGQPVRVTFSDGKSVEVMTGAQRELRWPDVQVGTEWFRWEGRYTPCPK